jgi:hypothetical protein
MYAETIGDGQIWNNFDSFSPNCVRRMPFQQHLSG